MSSMFSCAVWIRSSARCVGAVSRQARVGKSVAPSVSCIPAVHMTFILVLDLYLKHAAVD
eukprot:1124608-Karenia_brevis.AAC.1